ncbi:MAG TPA: class I SAM-dependent methyltransferase, partial [Candidatus Baltobacteraceae bacterium]|nr:class I SAM-dependent methyltransferase [Candidatus Baltobacteraceae bacterium]
VLNAHSRDVRVRHEFNLMAAKGSGEHMEHDHVPLMKIAIEKMNLSSDDSVLDLGCGAGWASLMVRSRLGESCRVVGVDISDEFVRRASAKSQEMANVSFLQGTADQIPSSDAAFTKVLSFSSFYYFPDPKRALKEIFRVVAPGGRLFILTCLYKDRPDWAEQESGLKWEARTGASVHVLSAKEYEALLSATGWREPRTEEIVLENSPDPHHSRALLISGSRPLLPRGENVT